MHRHSLWPRLSALVLVASSVVFVYAATFWLLASRWTPSRVESLALTDDGSLLVVGANGGNTSVWSVASSRRLHSFTRSGIGWSISTFALSPNNRLVAAADEDSIDLIEIHTGNLAGRIPRDSGRTLRNATFSPDGNDLALGCDFGLEVWGVSPPAKRSITFDHHERVYFVAYSPDGAWLASGGDSSDILVWNAKTGQRIWSLPRDDQGGFLRALAFSADGKALRSLDEQGQLLEWDLATQQRTARQIVTGEVACAAFSRDRSRLAVGTRSGPLFVFDAQFRQTFENRSGGRRAAALSADGTRVAGGGSYAYVWSAINAEQLGRYRIASRQGWIVGLTFLGLVAMWTLLGIVKLRSGPSVVAPPAASSPTPASVVEAPAPSRGMTPRRADVALVILVVGGTLYALGCFPAIGRRGYPPIDAFWMAIPWLWPFPVLISALFDGPQFSGRRKSLLWYALATAFFDAGTAGGATPRNMGPLEMLVLTLIGYGPLHLLGVFLVDAAAQVAFRPFRRLADSPEAVSDALPRRLVAVATILSLIAIAFPVTYRTWKRQHGYAQGRAAADADWNKGEAKLLCDRMESYTQRGDYSISREYDPATGLKLESRHFGRTQFQNGYADRVAELLVEGPPPRSMKPFLIRDEDLIAMATSPAFQRTDTYPLTIAPNVDLIQGIANSRWGGRGGSRKGGISIMTPHGLHGLSGDKAIEFGRSPAHPQVIFVRTTTSIMAFHDSGVYLGSASWPPTGAAQAP